VKLPNSATRTKDSICLRSIVLFCKYQLHSYINSQ